MQSLRTTPAAYLSTDLIKHPKYKDTWSNSFGKEIRRLATTTETKFSSTKRTFHKTAKVTKLMKELYVSTEKARKTSTAQKSQLGATSSTTPETVVPQLQISSQSSSSSTASDPNPLQNSCPLTSKTSIFALQWKGTSIFEWRLDFSQKISSKSTTYTIRLIAQATFTAKSDKACIDYPKQESSHTNY